MFEYHSHKANIDNLYRMLRDVCSSIHILADRADNLEASREIHNSAINKLQDRGEPTTSLDLDDLWAICNGLLSRVGALEDGTSGPNYSVTVHAEFENVWSAIRDLRGKVSPTSPVPEPSVPVSVLRDAINRPSYADMLQIIKVAIAKAYGGAK